MTLLRLKTSGVSSACSAHAARGISRDHRVHGLCALRIRPIWDFCAWVRTGVCAEGMGTPFRMDLCLSWVIGFSYRDGAHDESGRFAEGHRHIGGVAGSREGLSLGPTW